MGWCLDFEWLYVCSFGMAEDIRGQLLKYGYEPMTRHISKHGAMKLKFLPTGKTEYLRWRQFEYRKEQGLLKPVIPQKGVMPLPTNCLRNAVLISPQMFGNVLKLHTTERALTIILRDEVIMSLVTRLGAIAHWK
jgi:hypothetical protein